MNYILQHTIDNWQINFYLYNECEFVDTRDNYNAYGRWKDGHVLLVEHLHHVPEKVIREAKKVFEIYENVKFITQHPFEAFLLLNNRTDVTNSLHKNDENLTNSFYQILEQMFLSNENNKSLSPEELFVPLFQLVYKNEDFCTRMNRLFSFYHFLRDENNA